MDPLVEFLKKEFEKKKDKNSSFSMRRFSQLIDIDPSNLRKIMNYEKKISRRTWEKITERLKLSENSLQHLSFESNEPTSLVFAHHTDEEDYFSIYIDSIHLDSLKATIDDFIRGIEPMGVVPKADKNVLRLAVSLKIPKK